MSEAEIAASLTPYEWMCLNASSFRANMPERLVDFGLVELGSFRHDGVYDPTWKNTAKGDAVSALRTRQESMN